MEQQECNCGKSPTGKCDEWHNLEGAEYFNKLAEYREQQKKK